jgi:SAM-dependent methyltransferase
MAKTSRVENEIAHGAWLAGRDAVETWGWGSPAGKRRANKRAARIIEGAGLHSGLRALELGCGTGMFTQIFAATGAEIIANDISPDLLAIARKENPQVTFILGRFEELDERTKYDAIIGSSVLHHLDVEAALLKCTRLLKPGGALAFAEPNMLNPQIAAERNLRSLFPYISPDETAFVRFGLAPKLNQLGFTNIRITPFDWLHPAVPAAMINTVEAIGKVLENIPLVREFSGSLLISCKLGSYL